MSSAVTAAFATRSAILWPGSARRAPSAEQVALNLLEHRCQLGVAGGDERGPGEAEMRVQLVDLTVGGDARVGLGHALSAEQTGFALVAGLGIDFQGLKIIEGSRGPRGSTDSKGSKAFTGCGSTLAVPVPGQRQQFRRRLLKWYRANGRDLPWRNTSDPYHILVSEMMLQQTQVDRVLPKYQEWLEKYPSLTALADAARSGRHRDLAAARLQHRPRRLHAIARESVERYGGELPSRRSHAPIVQRHRRIHSRSGHELRLRTARSHPRHQRRPRPVPASSSAAARRRRTR